MRKGEKNLQNLILPNFCDTWIFLSSVTIHEEEYAVLQCWKLNILPLYFFLFVAV